MKNALIVSGIYDLFLIRKKELYFNKENCNDFKLYDDIFKDKQEYIECSKIYNANRQRKHNNWNEICKWVFLKLYYKPWQNYNIIFGTLTFDDETLKNTCKRTRTRYITKFLSAETIHYVANIDFGEKNHREHYHFIAIVKDKINCKNWVYGGNKMKKVLITPYDLKRVKNYVMKLNNHSYKATTKQQRIIRDRNQDEMEFIVNFNQEEFRRFKIIMNSKSDTF